jgi:hypothetical protein
MKNEDKDLGSCGSPSPDSLPRSRVDFSASSEQPLDMTPPLQIRESESDDMQIVPLLGGDELKRAAQAMADEIDRRWVEDLFQSKR